MSTPLTRNVTLVLALASFVTADGSTNTAVTADGERIIAGFTPLAWPAVIALILYGASGLAHWYLWFRNGRRPYMLVLAISMTCMTIGFIMRLVYRGSPASLGLYIMQTMFTLLSPCGFLAMDYMLLGRLATAMGEEAAHCLLLPAARIAKIFVWSDVVTFLLQASGGGMSSSAGTFSDIGPKISIAGLAIQLASFLFFTVTLITFTIRVRRRSMYSNILIPFRWTEYRLVDNDWVHDWRPLAAVILVTCVGILVRSVFRLIEFAEGYYGFLATHEGYFYLLDALPLWLAMTLYCFFWPTRFIDGVRETYAGGSSAELGLRNRRSPFSSASQESHAGSYGSSGKYQHY